MAKDFDENSGLGEWEETDMFEDEEIEYETVTLEGENGKEEFIILDSLEHKNKEYLLLVKDDFYDGKDEVESLIMRVDGEDGDDYILSDIDDGEIEEIGNLFKARMNDYDIEL